MAPLLLVLLLQAPPSPPAVSGSGVAVVVSRRTGVDEPRAADLSNRVYAELIAVAVPVSEHPSATLAGLRDAGVEATRCEAEVYCLSKLGQMLGAEAVVSVDVGAVLEDLAVHLQAVSTDGGSLAEHTFVAASTGSSAELAAQIEPFAKAVAKLSLSKKSAPEARDAPRVSTLLPGGSKAPAVAPEAIATGPSRTGAYVATGGAGALAVTAIVFGFVGLQKRNEFQAQIVPGSAPIEYRRSQAQMDALAASTNQSFAIAGGSAVASVATGAIAAWLWTQE